MRRFLLSCATLLMAACNPPGASGVKVIVGAKLLAAPDRPPLEYSVVVIEDKKFREVGPQASTPVPKGAEITRGNGLTIEPAPGGGPIEPGSPANLVLRGGETVRVMRDGEWVP